MVTNSLQSGSVHARVSFRGSTVELLSGNPFPDNNVSSVEKLGTGLYKINYSTSLSGADHPVATSCQIARGGISPGCMELVATDVDSATIAAKLAGEGYGTPTYFDPDAVDFIASSTANVPVNLSINTVKAWASIKNGVLVDGLNIESVSVPDTGATVVNFIRGFRDYTVIATGSNGPSGQATASVTYSSSRSSKSITLYTYGFGESVNSILDVKFTPEYLNLIVFGNFGGFSTTPGVDAVSLDKTIVSGTCEWGTLGDPTGCSPVTDAVTATVVGGAAPYTYQWKYVVGSGATGIQISNPTSATTTFSKFGTDFIESAKFYLTVTDSTGATADSDQVEVILSRTTGPIIIP